MKKILFLFGVIAIASSAAGATSQENRASKQLTNMKSVCTHLEDFIVRTENASLTALATHSRNLEYAKETNGDVENALKELSDSNKAWSTAIMELADKWDKLSCAVILYGKP